MIIAGLRPEILRVAVAASRSSEHIVPAGFGQLPNAPSE